MECLAKSVVYSSKQNMFMVVFELSGPNGVLHEVVLYWEQTDPHTVNSKGSSVKGLQFLFSFFFFCLLDNIACFDRLIQVDWFKFLVNLGRLL